MADKSAVKPASKLPRRLNRTVPLGDAMGRLLEPAFRKRGFASRDILTHWAAIAPKPYGETALPDRLAWPRGERSAEGATLYLRALPGHGFAIAHDAPAIVAAVNRYFGYLLVGQVRLSAEPFSPHSAPARQSIPTPEPETRARVGDAVSGVTDEGLKEALRQLGHAMASRKRK